MNGMNDAMPMPMGGPPPGMAPPMFPSVDPQVVGDMLQQILQMQQQDHQNLAGMQQQAFMGNPIVQALMGGGSMAGTDVSTAPEELPEAPVEDM